MARLSTGYEELLVFSAISYTLIEKKVLYLRDGKAKANQTKKTLNKHIHTLN